MSISLVREAALSHFADNLLSVYSRSLRHAWLISPWITTTKNFYALNTAISVIQSTNAGLTVITRPQEKPNHHAAVEALKAVPQAEIFELRDLHAKVCLLECDGIKMALVGSANFTEEGESQWIEVTADIRSSRNFDEAATFIEELRALARELTAHPSAKCIKSCEPGWWRARNQR